MKLLCFSPEKRIVRPVHARATMTPLFRATAIPAWTKEWTRHFTKARRPTRSLRYSSSAPSASIMSTPWPVEITRDNADAILDQFDTLILDCDGVIWHVDHATKFGRVQAALNKFRDKGKRVLFASNNSIPSTEALTEKILRLTGYAASPADNFSVNRAVRFKLEQLLEKPTDAVYLMASQGLEDELTLHGINHFGNGPDDTPPSYELADIAAIPLVDDVKVVVVGQDEHFNFMKLTKAASYLKRRNGDDWQCHFLATSWETGYEFAPGRVQPIAGSLAQCVAACANREPTYIGKPGPIIMEAICGSVPGFDKSRALMIGDSLRSDMGFAKHNGIASLAVLSGVSSVETMRMYQEDTTGSHYGMPLHTLLPDYYVGSILDLADALK